MCPCRPGPRGWQSICWIPPLLCQPSFPFCKPDEALIEKDLKRHVVAALNTLTQREKNIITAYFGIGDDKTPITMAQIGRKMGLSRERIRQITRTSLNKLRHPSIGRRLASYADEKDAYVWGGAKKEYT